MISGLRLGIWGVGIAAALALGACGNGTDNSSGSASSSGSGSNVGTAGASLGTATTTVEETDAQKFSPSTIQAKVGDILAWKNTGTLTHNVTFDSATTLNSQNMNGGDVWEVKFSQAGTYSYKCTFHPGMTGTITVS